MPPKKGKKGGAADGAAGGADAITAVDRTFYELTITDLNNKLAHLRDHNVRIDGRNLEMEARMRQLEEDRTDVTAYLDRTLQEKTNINADLEEKLSELAAVRAAETVEFKRQIREQELRYKTMQDELTSEIKLLTGKLNSLEEFRIQKDELLAKFDQQEDELRIQTKNHRELVYDIERKQVIDKDRMKREVENRLLQLSNEFAKSNEIRISAHVQRLVRENIAINNELDRMMFSQRRLQNENAAMQAETQQRRITALAVGEERDRLIRDSDRQVTIIRHLTAEYEQLQAHNTRLAEAMALRDDAERRTAAAARQQQEAQYKCSLLEQQLTASGAECIRHQTLYKQQSKELERLAGILLQLKHSIRSAMKGEANRDGVEDHPEFRAAQRRTLLADLMALLLRVHEPPPAVSSFETVPSVQEIYRSGDLLGMSPSKYSSLGEIATALHLRRPVGLLHRSRQNVGDLVAGKEQEAAATALGGVRSYESWPIVDMASGSALLLSESSEGGEAPPEEEGLEEDKGVSSSDDEVAAGAAATAAVAAAAPAAAAVQPAVQPVETAAAAQKSTENVAGGEEESTVKETVDGDGDDE